MARKIKQTLKEFQAWLQGVEELQPDTWAPTHDQWILIRKKIANIVVEKQIIIEKTPMHSNSNQLNNNHSMPLLPVPAAPAPGGVPIGNVDVSPAARMMLDPSVNGGTSKTPNIDTSDGNVTSSFE